MKNLREALEKYKRNKMSKATFEDDYMEGFQDCTDLLFPLVEALEKYADRKNWRYQSNNDVGAHDAWLDFKPDHFCKKHNQLGGYTARQALSDLKAKLGVE